MRDGGRGGEAGDSCTEDQDLEFGRGGGRRVGGCGGGRKGSGGHFETRRGKEMLQRKYEMWDVK